MKQKLLNKLWLRVGMIVAVMTTTLAGTVWGQTVSVNSVLWKEPFTGGGNGSFSATSDWSSYVNPTTFVAADKSSLVYSSSVAMISTGSASNMTNSHVWLNKNNTGYFQIEGIKLYNTSKVTVSWAQAGATKVTVAYAFDGGSDYTDLSNNSSASAKFTSAELNVNGHTTINLKFHRTSTGTNLRLDDLTLIATEVTSDPSSDAAFANETPSIDLKDGNTYSQDATTAAGYSGTITYALSANTAGATIAGSTVTVTQAGSVTVTATAPAVPGSFTASEASYTLTVSDTRSACATGIDLSSAKTITKGASASITATSTKADGFSGEIEYTFVSANSSIFSIADGNYTGAGVGATTVTVTATPTGGNAAQYKPASQEVDVTVNGTNSISLSETSKSQAYTAGAFTLTATVPTENYNGTVSAESSNDDVVTVSVEGTSVTVTPVAVGTATITVTAGEDTYYPATASAPCTVTVTAPEGKTTAYQPLTTLFKETFNSCEGTGGRDDTYTGNVGTSTVTSDQTWTGTSGHGACQCIKLGTGSATQSVKTGTIGMTGNGTLTFWAAGWGDSNTNKVTVSAEGATLSGTTEITLTASTWKEYTIDIEDATGTVKIQFAMKRGFLDDVVVTQAGEAITAKLNASGYATFCSEYPLDFSEAEANGYSAWQITAANSSTGVITFSKITGSVKGGTGVLLKGTAGETVELTSANSTTTLSGNLLEGTLAPTLVAADEYYGLSGNEFVKVNAGTVPAGKALLPANALGSNVKAFTFVFEDDATGINEELRMKNEESSIYNLAGQRLDNSQFTIHNSQLKRGIYIVNGKKVLK